MRPNSFDRLGKARRIWALTPPNGFRVGLPLKPFDAPAEVQNWYGREAQASAQICKVRAVVAAKLPARNAGKRGSTWRIGGLVT